MPLCNGFLKSGYCTSAPRHAASTPYGSHATTDEVTNLAIRPNLVGSIAEL